MLELRAEHTAAVVTLPSDHRDPFDLLLAAQTVVERLTIVTADDAFEHLGVNVLPA